MDPGRDVRPGDRVQLVDVDDGLALLVLDTDALGRTLVYGCSARLIRQAGFRARSSRQRGVPSLRRPKGSSGRVSTVKPAASRSARTPPSGKVR